MSSVINNKYLECYNYLYKLSIIECPTFKILYNIESTFYHSEGNKSLIDTTVNPQKLYDVEDNKSSENPTKTDVDHYLSNP